MMRSLYFKIFIWFWLAMALVSAVVVLSAITTQTGESASRWRSLVGEGLSLNGRAAVEAYERAGRSGLTALFEQIEQNTDTTTYLFDVELRELSGREVPPAVRDLARRVLESGRPFRGRGDLVVVDGRRVVARRVRNPAGEPYVIASVLPRVDFPRGPRSWTLLRSSLDQPGALALRLMMVFLTAGLVCYGLARYLTAPVKKLREATHRLSSGDLSARVTPAIRGRRDEIAELGRDFDQMATRIESLVTAQRRLLSDISHELRSPLARLNVALGLARQRAGDSALPALDRIERESERLNDLIGQVLVLSRLESGIRLAERTPVELNGLVRDVVADADFEARDRGRGVDLVEAMACTTMGSERLLRSAFENVVRNAVRYTTEGTRVEVALRLRATDQGARAVFTVRDHGPGVPEGAVATLFEPFYRVEDSRDRGSGGTGLGLAIARRAVLLHEGAVTARNAVGGGLEVEIDLPVA